MAENLIDAVLPPTQDTLAEGRIGRLQASLRKGDIKKASQEFEAYFISYLLKTMRATVPKSAVTQNRMGDMFQSFYDEYVGREAAKVGGLGLAQMIEATYQEDQASNVRERNSA